MRLERPHRAARRCAFSIAVCVALGFSGACQAQISVSPTALVFDEKPGTKAITVTNTGTKQQVYRVSLINLRMETDGRMVRAEIPRAGEQFAAGLVRFAPHELNLAPGASEVVRLQVTKLPAGEYRTHVLVQQVPDVGALEAAPSVQADGLDLDLHAIFGVAIPLLIREGDLPTKVTLANARLTVLPDGSRAVSLALERSGARTVRGALTIQRNGREIALYDGISVYAPTPERDLVLPLPPTGLDKLRQGELKVHFEEPEETKGALSAEAEIAIP